MSQKNMKAPRFVLITSTLLATATFPMCRKEKPVEPQDQSSTTTTTTPSTADTTTTTPGAAGERTATESAEEATSSVTETVESSAEEAGSAVTGTADKAAEAARDAMPGSQPEETSTAPDTTTAEGTPPEATDALVAPATPAIDLGTLSTEQVRALQSALVANGASIQVDGVVGSATRGALESFQTTRNLPVDGSLNEATLSGLNLKADDFMSH